MAMVPGRIEANNVTQQEHAQAGCVPQLVTAQSVATPDAVAVTHNNVSLSYKELDRRASEVACVLRSLGVGPDIVVGLYVNRSLAMVVGALGILKAGGAYLALDPAHPKERLAFELKDASAAALVTLDSLANGSPVGSERTVVLDYEGRSATRCSSETIGVEVKPENLAYVIYTSGSTGQPKGVELTHAGLANLVRWHQGAFSVSRSDQASQLAAISFDASVWEVWPYLASGATLHLGDCLAKNDPEAIRDWMIAQGITIGFLPTPLAEYVMNLKWPATSRLRVLLTGADTLHHRPPRGLPFELINNYGPTECTVVATSGVVSPDGHPDGLPSIGSPIDNTQVYILDENMQQVAAGQAGEMYIGGVGVARGYRSRADLTAERFVPDPFSSEAEARLYRTGDLARYLPDGQIAFLGRVDEQIKIRGFRIEPGEIVKVLDEHPAVQASAVVAREFEPGDRRLVAYLVLAPNAEPSHSEVRNFLAASLPEHMCPAMFVALPALPLNTNGKIDRSALPDPTPENTLRDDDFVAPTTPLEEKLAPMVAGLLGLEQVSVEDNFFLLGGHSLLGTQLTARIRDTFEVEMPLRVLFEQPTVRALAAEIEQLLIAKIQNMSDHEAKRVLDSSTGGRGIAVQPSSTPAA